MYKKGFTLIELLVVIAIIGVLASVVLASLNDARSRGQDAAVKGSVNNARAQAALYYDTNGNYTAVCTTGSGGIGQFLTAADDTNGSGAATCADGSATAWAMNAQLVSTTSYYCVDSTGYAGNTSSSTITDGSDWTC